MSTNPKATLIRNTCKALSATFRRAFGEASRTLVNPSATVAIRDGLVVSLQQLIKAELSKSNIPVVTPTDSVPEGAHWLVEPLGGRRNFAHGRLPVTVDFAFIMDDGTCPLGAVYFPQEDVLVLAERGTGAKGPDRFRASGRTALHDALLLLPMSTIDTCNLKLMEMGETLTLHTRKTGHPLFDAIDVASGRADIMVGTRLNRLEVLLAELILSESAAKATQLDGKPLTPASTTLLAANLKLHPLIIEALPSSI
ncbi:MAG: inositol monophosphatase family protein [Alphaproteobacteria bacterium]